MAGVDGINGQSLYFAAAQAASHQQAKETDKEKKLNSTQKTSFINSLEKSQQEFELANDGLPVEIAGMTEEEAIVFLKDEVDLAGNNLTKNPTMERISDYRRKLGNFMKYISKNNYEVLTLYRRKKGRPLINVKTGKPAYYTQVQVINQKLEQLADDLVYNHKENIDLLKRLEEINGLIVDLLAS